MRTTPFLRTPNYSEVNQTAWGTAMFEDLDSDGLYNWQDPCPYDPTMRS
ncbi:MAG: hypothetical protein R3F13_14535 [Prosthecobacter sp.]